MNPRPRARSSRAAWSRTRRAVAGATVAAAVFAGVASVSTPATATPVDTPTFAFQGAGNGHGIGLSQWGARGYAVNGWSAEQILQRYYTGAATAPYGSGPLRVWLADTGSSTSFSVSAPTPVTADSDPGGVTADPAGGTLTVSVDGSGRLSLTQGGRSLITTVAGPLVVRVGAAGGSCTSAGSATVPVACARLSATGVSYGYGSLEFSALGGGVRVVERDLTARAYLYGLAEVPSSWPAEALKAQVVAARSYALAKQRISGDLRSDCRCTVRASTSDQVFAGLSKLADPTYGSRWQNAVDVTDGVVVSADGRTPVQAFYSASSGGRTESNEGGFGGSPLSYLRSVDDPGDEVPGNPWSSWVRTFTGAQLGSILGADSRTAVGTLRGVEIGGPYTSGARPTAVTLVGSSRTTTVTASTFAGVVNARAAGTFPSLLFTLAAEPFDRATVSGAWVAPGADAASPLLVYGSGTGAASRVRVVRSGGSTLADFSPYGSFTGGVRVAWCTDDAGSPFLLTAPGPGGVSDIRQWTPTGSLIRSFTAFPSFTGGAFVACGRVGPTGENRLVVGADAGGGPAVAVFDTAGRPTTSLYATDASFGGGVRVAVGSVLGNGRQQLVTGTGPGGGDTTQVIDAVGTADQRVVADGRTSGAAAGTGAGVYVAVLSGAPGAVIAGSGDGGAGRVTVRRLDGTVLLDRTVVPGPVWGGAARVAWSPELGVVAATAGWPDVRAVP